jgi:hypothetical protein
VIWYNSLQNSKISSNKTSRLSGPSFEAHISIKEILLLIFLKRFIGQRVRVYTVCTRINYKIVPVASSYKYLHYGTSGTEYVYSINIGANNGIEKSRTKKKTLRLPVS